MLVNTSGKWLYLDKHGKVLASDGPAPNDAATVFCAPGGSLDEYDAAAHGAQGYFVTHDKAGLKNPVTGEDIVLKNGRACADRLARPKVVKVAPVTGEIKVEQVVVSEKPADVAHVTSATEAKAVSQASVENKGMDKPKTDGLK